MTDKHLVLLPRTPWAGPAAFQIAGPETDLHRGREMDPPDTPYRYELRVDNKADDPTNFPPLDLHDAGKGHLLMSNRLVDCLDSIHVDNLQYFLAEVVDLQTGGILQYQTANIIGLVSALDIAASVCRIDEDGFVEDFSTLVLDPAKTLDRDLFRLYESFHTIIISKRVADALKKAGITGAMILPQEEWRPGML